MTRLSCRSCVVACFVVISVASTAGAGDPVSGQPAVRKPAQDPQDTASQARELFNEGTDLARRGDWLQALSAFERASAVHPHAATTYNIGYCERALGRYTRARKMLSKALGENARHGGGELPDEQATAARTYLAEVERQIARPLVSVSPPGASILVDGRPLEPAGSDGPRSILWAGTRDPGPAEPTPASVFELDLDPGSHVFVVSATGYAPDMATRTFEPGAAPTLVVQLSQTTSPSAQGGRQGMESRNVQWPITQKILGLSVGGAGVVGLGLGSVFGFVTFSTWNSAKSACGGNPSQCNNVQVGESQRSSALSDATISTIAFTAGGVLLAAGAALFLTSGSSKNTTTTATVIAPAVGPSQVGMTMCGVL